MLNIRSSMGWTRVKHVCINPFRRAAADLIYGGRVPLAWCKGKNWGDALSPVIVSLLSGKSVVHLERLHNNRFMVIGSILDNANEHTEVWGAGFIREDGVVIAPPRAVYAVRGPLTRALLLKQGIDCPEIYGDPALLLPRFYNPSVPKRYAVGIIPHYIDKTCKWLERYRNKPGFLIIDIEAGTQEFVRDVKSCDVILSSSLHGLICADAYGIPNEWVQLSSNVIGGHFKFRDYRLSIGANEPMPLRLTEQFDLNSASRMAVRRTLNLDLTKLILACPFLSEDLRREIIDSGLDNPILPRMFASAGLTEN